jgi:putative transposase
MWLTLRRAGEQVPRCQVQRLMKTHGIVGAKRRGKPWRTTEADPQAARRPDLVQRDFSAEAPNRLWVAELSYLRCWEGLVYFAFVLDACSRMIVGWQLATHLRTDLVLDALKMALGRRGPGADVELVHHSDRGSQYTSIDYRQTLSDQRVLASVGSVGDASHLHARLRRVRARVVHARPARVTKSQRPPHLPAAAARPPWRSVN